MSTDYFYDVSSDGKSLYMPKEFFTRLGVQDLSPLESRPSEGGMLYRVAYTLRNVRKARELQFGVRSPIHSQYKWPGFSPLHHQRVTAAFFTLHNRAYCFNGLGSGKTMSALWAADYLLSIGEVTRVLVISPLSTLPDAWAKTLFTRFPHLKTHVVHGAGKSALLKAPSSFKKVQVFMANHELMRSPDRAVFAARGALPVDLIIVDEGASFRALGTGKGRGLKSLAKDAKWMWWMTATPTPNAPTDAWVQADIMGTRGAISYGAFRDLTMYKVTEFQWEARNTAPKHVSAILSPSICFKTDDCIDLPGITYQARQADMTKDQKAIYSKLSRDAYVELTSGGVVTAMNEGIKANKLLQVACGILYTDDSEEAEVTAVEKIKVVEEVLEETDTPVILFAPYKSVVRFLKEKLKRHNPQVITGEVSLSERVKIFDAVQKGTCRLLIAHPKTMSHGVTLTTSACIVWFAPTYSNEIYEQANGRIYRYGQTRHCTVIHITSCAVEKEIYRRLETRQKMQGALLNAVKTEIR